MKPGDQVIALVDGLVIGGTVVESDAGLISITVNAPVFHVMDEATNFKAPPELSNIELKKPEVPTV
jgi:hypothetical protein